MFTHDHATSQSAAPSALLTKQEAAEFLTIAVRTLDDWRQAKLIPFIKRGGYIRFRREDLEAFLHSHTQIPAPRSPYRPRKQPKP
jgi:excisionase family DNA binding protein